MTLRVRFSAEDLARVRLTTTPDPLAEATFSLPLLQRSGAAALEGWRQRSLRELSPVVRPLLELAPAGLDEYVPEAFIRVRGSTSLEHSLDATWSMPRHVWAADLSVAREWRPSVPRWIDELHDGDREATRLVDRAFRSYYDAVVAPYWRQLAACVQADRAHRVRLMAEHGVERLLATLHPSLRWESPVLHAPCSMDVDLPLEGRGLLLTPTFFLTAPVFRLDSADPDAPLEVRYPVARELGVYQAVLAPTGSGDEHLGHLSGLLGRTRARVLDAAAAGGGTAELARRAGISPASASEHATVLRTAGLITTQRTGSSVRHRLTPLGRALLDGTPC
ncbi:winged helix-turn-helix transcriptional regulator [Streptomyces sp. AV19]|uniref:winged helix-turn-helix domain-containing protein n=1 Tax=Streptomyces sp. AV19 TaxID=2793068 RepID=UPI0018FE40E4|nr:winged helix-turn-helix domain-containing protein [Streptomyces sp. AV19]MBH1938804.1 winged helix-turn-helix transcriptional regulator [Streptomyces sp. AV19]MDG4534737.1 winged helix-turn-helix domain-containing protein [Streptomyces sp. AV19]